MPQVAHLDLEPSLQLVPIIYMKCRQEVDNPQLGCPQLYWKFSDGYDVVISCKEMRCVVWVQHVLPVTEVLVLALILRFVEWILTQT